MDHVPEGDICDANGCSTLSPTAVQRSAQERRSTSQLTIVSDVICPWCYVAKKNLEKALALTGIDLRVTWQPFELNPTMPREGMNRREYRSRKFGSWANSQQRDHQVAEAGERAGIAFRHDLMERTPNTFEAHRLIWMAEREYKQDALVEALFRAYFTEGRDVGNLQILQDIAEHAGLSTAAIADFRSGTGSEEVRHQIEMAQRRGVSAVPTFLLDGEMLFSGALPPEQIAHRLEEAFASHA